eukprot:578012-Heterocapsa_arctica.AAC.1
MGQALMEGSAAMDQSAAELLARNSCTRSPIGPDTLAAGDPGTRGHSPGKCAERTDGTPVRAAGIPRRSSPATGPSR